MLKLYGLLSSIIGAIVPCYVDHYPELETKVYPYSEITFPNDAANNTFSDNHLLSINVWDDKSTDITAIEGMSTAIIKALNQLHVNNEFFDLKVSKNTPNVLKLIDVEPHIQRRELRFICRVYKK